MAFYRSHFQVANVLPKMHVHAGKACCTVPSQKRVHKIWGNRELSPLHAAIKQITPPILNKADRVERLKGIVRCLSIVNLK